MFNAPSVQMPRDGYFSIKKASMTTQLMPLFVRIKIDK